MQTIQTYLSAASPAAIWTDALNDRIGEPPVLPYGGQAVLAIRLFARRVGAGRETLPLAELSGVAAWAFTMKTELGGASLGSVIADPGITVSGAADTDPVLTEIAIPLSLSGDALAAAIDGLDRLEVTGELAGTDADNALVYLFRLPHIQIFNRL